MCAAYCASMVLVVAARKLFQVRVNALVDLREQLRELVRSEIAIFRVDCSELAAIDGDQLCTKEVQRLAQQGESAADLPQGLQVVLAEVGNRLVIGPELFQQP